MAKVRQGALIQDEHRAAVVSDDGLYRYELERWWGDGPGVLWVMLNPSTADADVDDPTIRRCRGFTKAWGHSGFGVVNLFALRATKPTHLLDHPDPIGPRNDAFLRRWLAWDKISLVVAAWGAWKVPQLPDRDDSLGRLAGEVERPLWCLGKTKQGDPRHPLYVRGDQQIEPWRSLFGAHIGASSDPPISTPQGAVMVGPTRV